MSVFRVAHLFEGKKITSYKELITKKKKPSRVGKQLADKITKKTILLILLLLMITPHFSPDRGRWDIAAVYNLDKVHSAKMFSMEEEGIEFDDNTLMHLVEPSIEFGLTVFNEPMIANLLYLGNYCHKVINCDQAKS